MSDTAQKWLMGCGIGCAVAILLVAMLVGGGFYCARRMSKEFDRGTKAESTLETRFGRVRDYVPPLDGVVPTGRLQAFLAVRDSIAPLRGGLEDAFASFERAGRMRGRKDLKTIFGVVRGAVSMAPMAGDYFRRRNAALLAHEMGLGEYTYIYALGYFGFLGIKPEETLRHLRSDEQDDEEGAAVIRTRMHRRMLEILRNLQASLDKAAGDGAAAQGGAREGAHRPAATGGKSPTPPPGSFREALDAEIAKMLADDSRLPWQDGLPPAIAAGFAPLRDRLQASYIPSANLFEFGGNFQSHGGNIRIGGTAEEDSSF